MPKLVSTKQILMACQMAFDGKSNREIGKALGFTETTISGWRKLKVWQDFEVELIDSYKKQVLSQQDVSLDSVTRS